VDRVVEWDRTNVIIPTPHHNQSMAKKTTTSIVRGFRLSLNPNDEWVVAKYILSYL